MKTTINSSAPQIGHIELVGFIAAVMAINALAIDMMLPALGIIGDELNAPSDNDRQLIIFTFILGNGIAQIFFGPLVDRFGRRRILLAALMAYLAGSLLSVIAGNFTLLLAARAFQGISTAGARVAATAIVRDQCSGRKMAEVLSLATTVFMAAPIVAPLLGQIVMEFAPWRGIFVALLFYGLFVIAWAFTRIPETQSQEKRKPMQAGAIFGSYIEFLTTRQSIGYTLASALAFSGLFGYLGASEQIFLEFYELGDLFAAAFAVVAAALAVATFANSKLVSRFGMRRLMHSAVLFYAGSSALHLALAMAFGASLPLFLIFTSFNFLALGLIAPNCTALALEPMGHIAGAAAAANGFVGTTIGAVVGGLIARNFDGTPMPVITGFLMLGVAAIAVVLWTEKGQLFQAQNDPEQNA